MSPRTAAGLGTEELTRQLLRRGLRFATGGHSRRLAYSTLRRQSRNPHTYLEKVRHKLAYDRDPVLTQMSDKIAARSLVARTLGTNALTTAYAISHDPSSLPWDDLPREFVCKVNHGSGGIVIVWDGADPAARLPDDPTKVPWGRLQVRPEHADKTRLAALCRFWMTLDYSWYPGKQWPEWAYESIAPGVIVEEVLRDASGSLPDDYKFFVIHGRVELIRTMTERTSHHYAASTLSRDWEPLPVTFVSHGRQIPVSRNEPARPSRADDLISMAESLGSLTDSVRIDMYSIGSRIVFGEFTVYPNGGEGRFHPESVDLALGRLWHQDYSAVSGVGGPTPVP